jgi:hypothetical protein
MKNKLAAGTKWSSSDGKLFYILGTMEENDKLWVYYRNDKTPPEEFSCYAESFEHRFTPVINN